MEFETRATTSTFSCESVPVDHDIPSVPVKTSNIFRIDRTHLGDQGFPDAFFCFGLVFEIIAKNPQFWIICVC